MSVRSVSARSVSAPPSVAPSRGARFGGLDGLRAVAVALVLIYHFFPSALPGGFLGVDVFFVMSGFLITSLLLRELAATGRIDLLSFWRRRARRLLPAVALVIIVSTSLALAAGRDLLVGVAQQIAGAVFFVSNWVFVANGSDYFTRDTPELFRNFWSLAVEEQFYIVLPILAVLLFRLKSRTTWALALIALAVGSGYLMASLAHAGADPTRVYFGSDSHSFGLFLGAALAVVLQHSGGKPLGKAGQAVTILAAAAGFTALGVFALTMREGSTESFLGGFQLATIAAAVVVWAVTREGALAGRALDVAPLRWIGERSYGIYLWHWPLLLIATSVATSLGVQAPVMVAVVTLVATIGFAALSYRYVEQPVRRAGLRGALASWFSPRRYTPRQRRISVALAAVVAVTFPLTGYAVAVAPEHTTAAEHILRGQALLDAQRADPGATEQAADTGTPAQGGAGTGSGTKSSTDDGTGKGAGDSKAAGDSKEAGSGSSAAGDTGTASGAAPATPAPPLTVEGRDITAVGDSVMLASYPELTEVFPGIEVDAAVSRGLWAGVDILADMQAKGTLRDIVVVGLGTNGPVEPEALDALVETVGDRRLVLVDAHAERDWIPGVNATLTAFADSHRGVTLARWDSAVAATPEFLAEDGIHPGPEGGEIYAKTVRSALDDLYVPGEAPGWQVPRR